MTPPKHPILHAAFLATLALPASAVVNIDYVTVGNAGNTADPATGFRGNPMGAVAYSYQIGKYEVTNAQYAEFLKAADPSGANANGIYNSNMGSDARGGISFNAGGTSGSKYTIRTSMGDKPVNYVSWYDAARLTNWMHNGQGSGSTETGAYTLSGNTGIITKNVGATVWIPSEAEWYKAAYYDPTLSGGTGGYWEFQTQSNITPTVAAADVNGDITNSGANVVNYLSGADWNAQDGNVTTVGSAAASSYFGTFDQGGNVSEWNDLVAGSDRGIRGGSYDGFGTYYLNARGESFPSNEHSSIGFRLASAIPESTTGLLAILGLFPLFSRRRKA